MKKLLIILFFIPFIFGQDKNNIKINKILLVGADSFENSDINTVLRTREANILSKMKYDRRLVKLDAINIKTFYVSKGYLGVNVKDSVSIQNELADIYFIIDEGKRYYIKSIEIVGNNVLSSKSISKILGIKQHKPYNPVKTNSAFHILEDRYRQKGKLFAAINISDSIEDSVSINISINEGPDVRINNTFIIGNGLIDSSIVLRELLFDKSDIYNQLDIDHSQRQLLQTGIFSVANITPIKIAKSDSLVNLLIELRKYKQFEWISEGGYYPIEYYEGTEPVPGAGVLVEWRNRSIFNTSTSFSTKLSGQTLISNNTLNPKIRFDLGIANPWLYKIKIPSKAQIYVESFKDYISLGAPYVTRYGLELINTYFLDKIERRSFIESRLYLDRFSRKDYLNPETDLIINSAAESGTTPRIKIEKHSFEINFRLDQSDNVLYPTTGFVYLGQFNRTGGILGGNRDFVKTDIGIRAYRVLFNKVVLASQLKYGMIFGWNDDYHDYLYDKFYLGGSNSLRGWDMLRYRIDDNDFPSGDIIRIMNNWEVRFPIFWLLGGEIFLDGGNIYNSYENISLSNLSWDGGFGITLSTPLGPVRLDAARPINQDLGWKVHLGVQYIF